MSRNKKEIALGANISFSGNLSVEHFMRQKLNEPSLRLKEIDKAAREEGARIAEALQEQAKDSPLVRELQKGA